MNRNLLFVLLVIVLVLTGCDFVAGNFVWDDLDMDGIQDPGEPGIPGVTVLIRDLGSDISASTITDEFGFYSITLTRDGSEYQVEFTLPAGYVFSPMGAGSNTEVDSDADPSTGLSYTFIVEAGVFAPSQNQSIDAGVYLDPNPEIIIEESGFSIGDFVWVDSNANGLQDEDEVGMEDVQVGLGEVDTSNMWSTFTDAQGFYEFVDLDAGLYQLDFSAPEGYDLTLQDQGSDDAQDSDPDSATGLTAPFSLAADTEDWDAGLVVQASSGGGEPLSYCVGPDLADFPEGYSPLTGQMVVDPSLLGLRPVFLSVSLFPPSVRPPQGLSVAPITYQFYIGEGDTRMLVGFHGEFPEILFDPELDGINNKAPDGSAIVGDLVWFDLNGNNLQDEGEPGVPRIPVKLYVNGSSFATTVTDDNGHYYFDYSAAENPQDLQLEFDLPPEYAAYYFVNKDVGPDVSIDSDVFVDSGFTEQLSIPLDVDQPDYTIDVGLRRSSDRVEGVRSGRVFFEDIRQQFCGCVITAGADPTVAAQIQTCGFAASGDTSNIGASGVDIVQLGSIALQNSQDHACSNPNLSGNLYCTEVDLQGSPGQELFTFWNVNNRDHFVYSDEMGGYSWAKNLPADNENFEILTDGLNGETLYFENVVVMLTTMTQENSAGTIFEMDIQHTTGNAYIFRNGQMYPATWSTIGGEYEQTTGLLRPYRFLDESGNPFPFAPGQTFVQMLHTFHLFEETGPGIWRARFYAPAYP